MIVNSCLSIFYHQKSMHRLLENLRSLMTDPYVKSVVVDYFVFISSERGSSLRLILQTEEERQESACSYVFKQLELWLQEHPSKQYPPKATAGALFLDFPNNYLRYNLYSSAEIDKKEQRPLRKVLSELLLNFFGNHPLNDEALYTFSLYLHHHFYLSFDKEVDRTNLRILFRSMSMHNPIDHDVMSFEAPDEIEDLFYQFRDQCQKLRSNLSPAGLYNTFLTLLKSHVSFLGNELVVNCYSRLGLTNAIYSDVSLH